MNLGTPLFAILAKGGKDGAGSVGFRIRPNLMTQAGSFPPLYKTQGRRTHSFVRGQEDQHRGWATP